MYSRRQFGRPPLRINGGNLKGIAYESRPINLREGAQRSADFLKLKEAYLAKLDPLPFDDPEYGRFLRFYRHMTALGVIASYRAREINMHERDFHVDRRAILRLIGASAPTRLREELPWVRYRLRRVRRTFRRAPGYVKRRVQRAFAGKSRDQG